MSNMLIIRPIAPAKVEVTPGAASDGRAGTGAANLLTPDPKEVYHDGGGGGERIIDVVFAGNNEFDTVFVGFVGSAPNASAAIGSAAHGVGLGDRGRHFLVPTRRLQVPRRHILFRSPTKLLAGYVQIRVNAGQVAPMTIGVIAVGLAFQPRRNRELGGGRRPIDTGSIEALPGGGFGTGAGVVKSSFRWTLGDLDLDELDVLDELAMDRGNRLPAIVVENGDPATLQHQEIHYGLLDRYEPYERHGIGKSRWPMGITGWV